MQMNDTHYESEKTLEEIVKVANSRLGWYKRAGMNIINFILSLKVLETAKGDRPALVTPLHIILSNLKYIWRTV